MRSRPSPPHHLGCSPARTYPCAASPGDSRHSAGGVLMIGARTDLWALTSVVTRAGTSRRPRELDLLPAVEQRGRVALQRSAGQLKMVEVGKQPTDRGAHLLTGEVGVVEVRLEHAEID